MNQQSEPRPWFCPNCGVSNISASGFCIQCGGVNPYRSEAVQQIQQQPIIQSPAYGQPVVIHAVMAAAGPPKSRGAYVLLGLFLGGLGIHNFYAGYTGRGVAQLLIVLFGWWMLFLPVIAVWIWVIIEIITVDRDARGIPFA